MLELLHSKLLLPYFAVKIMSIVRNLNLISCLSINCKNFTRKFFNKGKDVKKGLPYISNNFLIVRELVRRNPRFYNFRFVINY